MTALGAVNPLIVLLASDEDDPELAMLDRTIPAGRVTAQPMATAPRGTSGPTGSHP